MPGKTSSCLVVLNEIPAKGGLVIIYSAVSNAIQELDSSLIQVKVAKAEVWHTNYFSGNHNVYLLFLIKGSDTI